ncbi:CigA protein [Rhizophagus irregularis DAOM 181602=DAOM 197198]|nr:CigA protein [Rhizophagus irregularis DAOM 181602=DAOM 197198]
MVFFIRTRIYRFYTGKTRFLFKKLFILLIFITFPITFFSSFKKLTPELEAINVTNFNYFESISNNNNPQNHYNNNNNNNNYDENEKFLTYLPHSQFHNQLIELKNAIVLAYLTNRTLIIPPIIHFTRNFSIPYAPLNRLYDRLNYYENIKRIRSSCNIKNSKEEEEKGYCSLDYIKHDSFIIINWEEIFDLNWIKNQIKIINRNDFSIEGLYKICNIPINNRKEKLIHTDSLFGSFRIDFKNENIIKWKSEMDRNFLISHPILLKVVNNIINKLGGFGTFLGVHVRTGDSIFKENIKNTIDLIIKDIKNTSQIPSQIPPQIPPQISPQMIDIPKSKNHFINCKSRNKRIIFIATDSSNPFMELSKIFFTFDCVFTLKDFEDLIEPLRDINYTFDRNIKMLDFFYPLIDLLIIANGMDVIGTPNSTFSEFAKFYHETLIYEVDD